MMNPSYLSSYALDMVTDSEQGELKQRLELYQVFSKLYEHHRSLLDEILDLEHSSKPEGRLGLFQYIQGIISERDVYLITNFLGQSKVFRQHSRTWTIGRDGKRATIPILDQRLSRCHAAIQYIENEGFSLVELGSTNGSFVNGERIRQRTFLRDGDRIRLGSLAFVFFVCDITQLQNWNPDESACSLVQPQHPATPETMAVAEAADQPAAPLSYPTTAHQEDNSSTFNPTICFLQHRSSQN